MRLKKFYSHCVTQPIAEKDSGAALKNMPYLFSPFSFLKIDRSRHLSYFFSFFFFSSSASFFFFFFFFFFFSSSFCDGFSFFFSAITLFLIDFKIGGSRERAPQTRPKNFQQNGEGSGRNALFFAASFPLQNTFKQVPILNLLRIRASASPFFLHPPKKVSQEQL